MKKEKYLMIEENFLSTIDGEYHREEYYTTNKKLYDKMSANVNACNRYDVFFMLWICFIALAIFFLGIGGAVISYTRELIPHYILCSLGIANCLCAIIFNLLIKKINVIIKFTSDWKQEFKISREYQKQAKAYKKTYEENLLKKKYEAATKLTNIYNTLDSRFQPHEKIESLVHLLDLQDTKKILNKK